MHRTTSREEADPVSHGAHGARPATDATADQLARVMEQMKLLTDEVARLKGVGGDAAAPEQQRAKATVAQGPPVAAGAGAQEHAIDLPVGSLKLLTDELGPLRNFVLARGCTTMRLEYGDESTKVMVRGPSSAVAEVRKVLLETLDRHLCQNDTEHTANTEEPSGVPRVPPVAAGAGTEEHAIDLPVGSLKLLTDELGPLRNFVLARGCTTMRLEYGDESTRVMVRGSSSAVAEVRKVLLETLDPHLCQNDTEHTANTEEPSLDVPGVPPDTLPPAALTSLPKERMGLIPCPHMGIARK